MWRSLRKSTARAPVAGILCMGELYCAVAVRVRRWHCRHTLYTGPLNSLQHLHADVDAGTLYTSSGFSRGSTTSSSRSGTSFLLLSTTLSRIAPTTVIFDPPVRAGLRCHKASTCSSAHSRGATLFEVAFAAPGRASTPPTEGTRLAATSLLLVPATWADVSFCFFGTIGPSWLAGGSPPFRLLASRRFVFFGMLSIS